MRALRSGAAVRLADLRVRQGRIEEAERLLADNEFDGQAALPLARLHLIRGEADLAAAVLRRSLGSATTTVLHAPALALLAEVRAVGRHRAEAVQVSDRLESLAAASGLRHVRALAERVDGLLRGADGLAHFEAALRLFAHAGLPWEAARTRMSIAHLLAGTLPEVAVAEGRAALEVFRALGAGRDADEAANLLRSLGVPAETDPPSGRRAHAAGARGAAAARRGIVEPADRRAAVPQQAHGRAPRRRHPGQDRGGDAAPRRWRTPSSAAWSSGCPGDAESRPPDG